MSTINAYQLNPNNSPPSPVPNWVKPVTPLPSSIPVKPHPAPPLTTIKENFADMEIEDETKLHTWRLMVLVGMVTFFAGTITGVSIMLFNY